MEFGIEKCAMLVMKSGKRHMREGVEQPNLPNLWLNVLFILSTLFFM